MNDTNGRGERSLYLRQNELTQKYIEFQVLKDLTEANKKILEHDKELLKKETNKLDKLHHEIWTIQNETCNAVWDFSKKHDFFNILNHFPDVPCEISLDCDCEDNNNPEDLENRLEVEQLLKEIEKLESDLKVASNDLLKEFIVKAEQELQKLQKEYDEMQGEQRDENSCKHLHNIENKTNKTPSNSNNIMQNRDATLFHNGIQSSSTDSTSANNFEKISSDSLKRKWADRNKKSNFITADAYMKNIENQRQFKNWPNYEKIASKPVLSNKKNVPACTPTDQPKKKFVLKTKSTITQNHKFK